MYRPPYYPPPYHYGGGGYYHRGGNTINIDNSTNINVGGGQGNRPGGGQGGGNRPTTLPSGGQGNLYERGKNPAVQPSRPTAGTQPAGARPSGSKPGASNNMYTDKSGNVYRTDGRNWQQQQSNGKFQTVSPGTQQAGPRRTDGGGQTTARPSTGSGGRTPTMTPDTRQQLQRDQASRSRGQERVNSYQSRPSPGAGTAGGARGGAAPRSGGGTMRSGGGRR
jgi:hypothetical protein